MRGANPKIGSMVGAPPCPPIVENPADDTRVGMSVLSEDDPRNYRRTLVQFINGHKRIT